MSQNVKEIVEVVRIIPQEHSLGRTDKKILNKLTEVKTLRIPTKSVNHEVQDELMDEKTTRGGEKMMPIPENRRKLNKKVRMDGSRWRGKQDVKVERVRSKKHDEKIFQIFIKLLGSAVMMFEATPSATVKDAKQEFNSKLKWETGDAYLTFDGKVLRGRDEVKSCGIGNGGTVQVMSKMRGGGRRKDKKRKAEKKHVASPRRSEPLQGAVGAKGRRRTREPRSSDASEKDRKEKSWGVVQQGQRWCGPAGVRHRTLCSRRDEGSRAFVTRQWRCVYSEHPTTTRAGWRVGEVREGRGRSKQGRSAEPSRANQRANSVRWVDSLSRGQGSWALSDKRRDKRSKLEKTPRRWTRKNWRNSTR